VNLELRATPEEVMRAVEAIRQYGQQRGLGEKELFGIALALEECGSNIVDHALRRDARQTFRINVEHVGNTLTIELRDRGAEFDPTAVLARKPETDEPPGGWGIQLVRRYMDKICYKREGGENVLSLIRKIHPESSRE
jgi:serine/threonine-protein kinase RsbW